MVLLLSNNKGVKIMYKILFIYFSIILPTFGQIDSRFFIKQLNPDRFKIVNISTDAFLNYNFITLEDTIGAYWFVVSEKNNIVNDTLLTSKLKEGSVILTKLECKPQLKYLEPKIRGANPVIVAYNRYIVFADTLRVPTYSSNDIVGLYINRNKLIK